MFVLYRPETGEVVSAITAFSAIAVTDSVMRWQRAMELPSLEVAIVVNRYLNWQFDIYEDVQDDEERRPIIVCRMGRNQRVYPVVEAHRVDFNQ